LNEIFLNRKMFSKSNRQSREAGSAWIVTDCAKGVDYPKITNTFCFKMDSSTIQNAHPNNTKYEPSVMLFNFLIHNDYTRFNFYFFGEDSLVGRCANWGVICKRRRRRWATEYRTEKKVDIYNLVKRRDNAEKQAGTTYTFAQRAKSRSHNRYRVPTVGMKSVGQSVELPIESNGRSR